VPQAAAAPPPPPPGFVPQQAAASSPDDDDQEDKPFSWGQFASDVASGFKTSLNQTGETAMKVVGAAVPDRFTPEGWKQSQAQTHAIANAPLDTGGKMTGAALENIIEFVAGDEALKGVSTAAKVTQLASVERALKNSPVLTRMLGNAVRAQTVGTTLAAAHGATGGEAVAQGSLAALGGAATEGTLKGAQKFLKLIRPTTADVLGETLPVLASQEPGASPLAENVAAIQSEPGIAKEQQQGGQRGIVNRAQRTAASELHKLNAARTARWVEGEGVANFAPDAETPVAPTDRQLPSGQPQLPAATATDAPQLEGGTAPTGVARTNQVGAYEGDFQPQPNGGGQATPTPADATAAPGPNGQRVKYVEEQPANFDPIDVNKEIQGVRTFGDAADLIRKHASPIFDRFDKATGGEYMRLRGIRDAAYSAGDYKGVNEAEKGIDDLFDSTRGKIDRTDYKAARTAWRSSRILDALHDAISRSINIPDEGIAADSKVWRGVNGGTLMRGLNRIVTDYHRAPVEDIIGPDGLTGLYKFSSLTQTPQRAALYGEKAADVVNSALADKRAGLIPSTIDWSRRVLFHQLAINPRWGQVMDYAIKHDIPASTTAKILVNVMGNTNRQQRTEDETVVPGDEERGIQPVTLPVLKDSTP
jgi:hypothetical protein